MIQSWWTEFIGLMESSLEGCTASSTFRANDINRVNWREMVNGGQLPRPFYVLSVPRGRIYNEYSALNETMLYQEIVIYGIYDANDPNMSIAGNSLPPFDPTGYMINQCIGFADTVMNHTAVNYFLPPDGYPVWDVSDSNPPNAVFLQNGTLMTGFSLTTGILLPTVL